jgi:hypothetical protein
MKTRRVRFSVKFLLVMTATVAVLAALWVEYGSHLRFAMTHLGYPEFQAARIYEFASNETKEEQILCHIGNIKVRIPSTLAENPTIVRESSTYLWLVFRDSKRNVQIPFGGRDIRAGLMPTPPQLSTYTVPKLIEVIVRSSSHDFSFKMPDGDLAIHNWVIRQHERDAGFSSVKRFALSSTRATDKILLSETIVSSSPQRVQSYLFWETRDFDQSGSVWFSDTSDTEASWIEVVAASIEPVASKSIDENHPPDFSKMTDAQIVETLCEKELE